MPSVDVEKEIYVDMVGVFEALTVFLEQNAVQAIRRERDVEVA